MIITDTSFITIKKGAHGFPLRELHSIVIARGDRGRWRWLHLRPESWQLCAVYKGHRVTLHESYDVRTFNQVVRAMRRAVEASGGP